MRLAVDKRTSSSASVEEQSTVKRLQLARSWVVRNAQRTIEDKKRKISSSTTETIALLRIKLAVISLTHSLVHECRLFSHAHVLLARHAILSNELWEVTREEALTERLRGMLECRPVMTGDGHLPL